jgi:hypothetical protein
MKRTFEINNTVIDLGNIKSIENDCIPMIDKGGYIIITLLKGKEYVFNENIGDFELIEPKIKIFAPDYGKAATWIESIEKEWNKYLIENKHEMEGYI